MKSLSLSVRLTLAGLMLALACNRLVNVLARDELVWVLHDVTISASITFSVMLAFFLMPYEFLRAKCAISAMCALCVVDLFCVVSGASGYWYWLLIQLISGVAAASFYLLRAHGVSLDELSQDYLYCLRAIPRGPQDLLISLGGFNGSDGGYSLFANGFIYRYRRGVLIKQKIASIPSDRYHVTRGSRINQEILAELECLVGKRWTILENCITVLGPIWRRNRE